MTVPRPLQHHRARSEDSSSEALPYVIELWHAEPPNDVELVLARAFSLELARSIFKAALTEYPERRVTLRKDSSIIAETLG